METTVAPLITREFLEFALKEHFQCNIDILDFSVANVVTSGDNFTSVLWRVVITYSAENSQKKTLSLIAKMFPEDEKMVNLVTTNKCFDTEIGIYGEVLPTIYHLDYSRKLSAKTFYTSLEPRPVILMEDLTTLGYTTYESEEGLDLPHCLIVMEKLAYLHAGSVAVHKKSPHLITKYKGGLYARNETLRAFISATFSSFMEVCEETPGFHHYVSKLSIENLTESLFLSKEPSESFNVLNHGDMWLKNLMFNYDSKGNIIDTLFVDFQYPFFGSPVLDLHFFWVVCTNSTVKVQHFDYIIHHYYNELVTHLLKLHVDTSLTFEELREDFRARAGFGFAAAVISLPLLLAARSSVASVDNFLGDGRRGSYRYMSFHSEKYMDQITLLLPFYDKLGVFP
ncbi:hypothetical protein RI129_010551 [Pyrocoelia pectoralis]|uniref:CHK kinase-like domain-containing protein n=1 Tax=Pyrocoelia pectoralis TaxID=417401 RepID=A0AAN7Z8Q5_9COLE